MPTPSEMKRAVFSQLDLLEQLLALKGERAAPDSVIAVQIRMLRSSIEAATALSPPADDGSIGEIEQRLKAATQGPWESQRDDGEAGEIYFAVHAHIDYGFIGNIYSKKEDGAFIAHAPTDIAYLLSIIRGKGT